MTKQPGDSKLEFLMCRLNSGNREIFYISTLEWVIFGNTTPTHIVTIYAISKITKSNTLGNGPKF